MNYIQKARSNYFFVKDEDKFEEMMTSFDGISLNKLSDGSLALIFDEDAAWTGYDEVGEPIDLRELVPPHLREGEVAIFMEIGWEGVRVLTGNAIAVNWKGEKASVDLDDIYKLAEPLGSDISRAEQ